MDRLTTYSGAVPLETDLLNSERFAMIALGYALQGYLGTGTVVDGFTCTQTTVASMNVLVNPGTIMVLGNTDGSTWSSLAADTTHQIIKQGLLYSAQTVPLTAPTTAGYSINYLIEAQQSDVDGTPVVLPYYNPSAPATAWTGPLGAGTTNNTVRQSAAIVRQNPSSVAAPTGTQVTPSVSAGYTPLFVVTVAYGQSTITSTSISTHPAAPFIQPGAKLPNAPTSFQNGQWTWAGAISGTNNLVATLTPPITAYTAGLKIRGNIVTLNTGATTLNVNGLGAVAVQRSDGVAMIGGELPAGMEAEFTHNGTNFIMSSPLPASFLSTSGAIAVGVPANTTVYSTHSGSPFTFSVPAGVSRVYVKVWGAGGGGGGAASSSYGGGGGGGEYREGPVSVTPGGTVTVTVGTGGAAGASGGGTGGTGGTSSFGASISSVGGGGGTGGNVPGAGGTGGSGGSLVEAGTGGGVGWATGGGNYVTALGGAAYAGAFSGFYVSSSHNGGVAWTVGGGGGGAQGATGAAAGAAGADGMVVVSY